MIYDQYDYEMFGIAREAVLDKEAEIAASYRKQKEMEKASDTLRKLNMIDSAWVLTKAVVDEVNLRQKLNKALEELNDWYSDEEKKYQDAKDLGEI